MKGIERPETERHTLTQLITDNGAKAIQGEKKIFFAANGTGTTGHLYG